MKIILNDRQYCFAHQLKSVDDLYLALFWAQLNKDWEKADEISTSIRLREERESQVAESPSDLRNNKGTVR